MPLNDIFTYNWGDKSNQWTGFKKNESGYYQPFGDQSQYWDWDTAPNEIKAYDNTPLYRYGSYGYGLTQPNASGFPGQPQLGTNPGYQLPGYDTLPPNPEIPLPPGNPWDIPTTPTDPWGEPPTTPGFPGQEPLPDNPDYRIPVPEPEPIDPTIPQPPGDTGIPPAGIPPTTPETPAIPEIPMEPPTIPATPELPDYGYKPPPFTFEPSKRTEFKTPEEWEPEAFQYSPEYRQIKANVSNFNPVPDMGEFLDWSQQDVKYTPEQIKSLYAGDMDRLQREQEYGLYDLMTTLQERGLGRSGQMYPDKTTPVGQLLERFGQQRSNVISDVLAKVIPQQEELTQSRRQLGLQGLNLQQTGYRTGVDLLGSIGAQDLAAGQLDETKLNNAASRASQAAQDALSRGNFELYADLQDFNKQLQSYRTNLESQNVGFTQGLQKTQTLADIVNAAISAGLMDDKTFYDFKSRVFDQLLGGATAA